MVSNGGERVSWSHELVNCMAAYPLGLPRHPHAAMRILAGGYLHVFGQLYGSRAYPTLESRIFS